MIKIQLSKPNYKIDKKKLNLDILGIQNREFTKLIRRRVVFFMDEYRYATYAVKKKMEVRLLFL